MLQNGRTRVTNYLVLTFKPFAKRPLKSLHGYTLEAVFPAALLNDALNSGKYDRGVIVAETFDDEVIDKAYTPYDNLSLLVSLKSTGKIEKRLSPVLPKPSKQTLNCLIGND